MVKKRSSSNKAQQRQRMDQGIANVQSLSGGATIFTDFYQYVKGNIYNSNNSEEISYSLASGIALDKSNTLVQTAPRC